MSLLAKTSGCPRRPVETRGQELDPRSKARRAHTRQRETIPAVVPQVKTPQRRRTHCTHRRAAGSASSLIAGIAVPHRSQTPYVPAASRAAAASSSRSSDSASPIRAAIFARSNAIVDPSGSCSSSSVVQRDPSITDANSSRRDWSRCSERDRSASSAPPKSVIAPVDPEVSSDAPETASAPTEFSVGADMVREIVSEPFAPCWPSRRRAWSRHRCGRPQRGSTR